MPNDTTLDRPVEWTPRAHSTETPKFVRSAQDERAIYCVFDGRARRIPSPKVLADYRPFIGAAKDLESADFAEFRSGAPLPMRRFPDEMTPHLMRQKICAGLQGLGIEYGAGLRPLAIPFDCRVRYADRFSNEEFARLSTAAVGQQGDAAYMDIEVVDNFEDLDSVAPESVDFIVACHVIEHLANPLKMFASAYRRLRKNGQLVLVIPDKTRTFDAIRQLTSLDHLIADYFLPSRERDFEHYVERFRIIAKTPSFELKDAATSAWNDRQDIHMHTFTYESFLKIANWVRDNIGYSKVWSHDGAFRSQPSKEMYFTFTK